MGGIGAGAGPSYSNRGPNSGAAGLGGIVSERDDLSLLVFIFYYAALLDVVLFIVAPGPDFR